MKKIRLNKHLASLGIASRRKIDEMITAREIMVNGSPIKTLGFKIDPVRDKIQVHDKIIETIVPLIYYAVNKPRGIISSTADEHGRKMVTDLIKSPFRLYPVGRLDQESTGLVLLTNDGELAQKLTHPRHHVAKIYQVSIEGFVAEDQLHQLQKGVKLKDGITAPAQARIVGRQDKLVTLEIVLHEGKNRQVRRMCAKVGLQLRELKRVAIGPVQLGGLGSGKVRKLTETEISELKNLS